MVVHRSWTHRNEIFHSTIWSWSANYTILPAYGQNMQMGFPSSQSYYRISLTPNWTEKSGFWKDQNTYFTHPKSIHKRDRNLYTRFSQAIQYRSKNSDTSNPSKISCVAYKNPLQTIHTKNPITKLTYTTQQHGKERLQLLIFFNTPTQGSDHQHIFHHPTSLWAIGCRNAKSSNIPW